MADRLILDKKLRNICQNVYFQPPATVRLKYPCIIYKLENAWLPHADNRLYQSMNRYNVMVIDQNPDSDLPRKVQQLPYCGDPRYFTADNLNHAVFSVYN